MMDDFESAEIQTGETSIFARWSRSGPPLLLMDAGHLFPEEAPEDTADALNLFFAP